MSSFTFVDLFAGIGGMRLGFERAGGECIFTSEWDTYAQKTYSANFDGEIFGDITRLTNMEDCPEHDVLVAGFPFQPFSIAGVSKHNALGRAHGFQNKTQGTLFFDVARIIDAKRPAAFMLENVKNLVSHDRGRTFETILDTLENDLGYDVHWKVIDGQAAVPQHRERIYIVGFRIPTPFKFPVIPNTRVALQDILEPSPEFKYTLTINLWNYLQDYAAKHRAAGNGFGFGLVDPEDPNAVTRTLSARYYKDGSEILLSQGDRLPPRRLTPRECARLMGFPDDFKIPVSDTRAYKQFGNSVVVPVVEAVAREITRWLRPRQIELAPPRELVTGRLLEESNAFDAAS
ncbi:MAG: DNA (cytosine-5-)-methyltransferase [Dehalococcoidia bacterium]|nr:DNA (cytosine-5-)-methyltransferase [Dehalococcoidia bacterium]